MRRLLVLLLALLLLAGCAPADVQPEDTEIQDLLQSQETAPQPEPPAPEYPAAFSMAYHKDHTLDPITCGEGIQQNVAALLYEPLFRLDESFAPVPLLCGDYSWDESFTTLTVTPRPEVTFSDGSSLTAADIAATLRRAAASPRYSYRFRQVSSITTDRSGQVIITLTTPNSGFVSLLDIPITKNKTDSQIVPIGTGPYLLVTGADATRLIANADWWQQKALPVDTIELVHAKDQDTAMYLFSSHRVELLTVDPTVSTVSLTGQVDSLDVPTASLQYVGFNTAEGRLFSSATARAAFSAGLQREHLVDAFLSDHALAAQFPISPLSALYPADLESPYQYEHFLSVMAAAGQNTGAVQELTLLVNEEDSFRLTNARFIAESMSLMDWKITLVALPWEEYLAALTAGEFDLYYGEVRLTADWDITDLVGTGGSLNYGGYSNISTDTYLATYRAAADPVIAAYRLCQHLRTYAPIAPLCFKSSTVLTHTGVVEGISAVPYNTFHDLENWVIHLDPA